MSKVRSARRRGRSPAVASARPAFTRLSLTVVWIGLGVAGVSAVAAAAICLPPAHGRFVYVPELRGPIAPALPASARSAIANFDVARTWREEHAKLASLGAVGPVLAHAKAWMPHGGLSTLLARRFPSAGHVRLPEDETATLLPLPTPRPEIGAAPAIVRNVPTARAPQLASLPPQTKSDELGILDRLFPDKDRAAKAIIAANPKTVLYDIVKRTVYMPDGEKLEAHSGFGKFMDDPDSMHRKDVGVTPPNIYTVSFREKPFHGVRALRMKPVGGSDMYGRDGFLTHSFLLGTNGESNGCISLRDYDKFLQAYEDGKFDKIIVLRSADEPVPAMVASAQGEGA